MVAGTTTPKQADHPLTPESGPDLPLKSIGNPVQGIVIPTNQSTTAIYAGAVMAEAPHADVAAEWLAFLKSQQAICHKYGFRSIERFSN